ncbi:conserved hypothetical protein [Culex quinquefasciatus]|uniref:Peptidase S1 domain-containing protein n=1 Tax=Culex quinquefasciatus TaxID=7176 RepID=B0W7N9_CULQU|nr:conserved hypothetical protein [Culex quinquefasciatus]|eukprot:XP_001844723.1 conserved hypothetical protein [Culex quinquefasciatus]
MNLWLSLWCAVAVIETVTGEEIVPIGFILTCINFLAEKGTAENEQFKVISNIWNSPTTVRLGDTHLESTEDDRFSQQIKIKHFKRHPQHTFRRKYHDIALIELEEEAIYNDAICPACLWLEKSAPLEPMNAVGFGETSLLGNLSPTLQKVTLKELRRNDCISRLPISNRTLPNGLMRTQICAAGAHQDTCRIDYGAPILNNAGHENIPHIYGVVSTLRAPYQIQVIKSGRSPVVAEAEIKNSKYL